MSKVLNLLLYCSIVGLLIIGYCSAVDVYSLSTTPPNTMIVRYSILSSSLIGQQTPIPTEGKNNSPLLKLKTQTLRRFEPLDNPRVFPVSSPAMVPYVHATFESKSSNSGLQLQIYTEPIQFSNIDSDICKYNYEVKKFFNSLSQNDGNSFLFNTLKSQGLQISSPSKSVSFRPTVSFTVKAQHGYSTLRNSVQYVRSISRLYPELGWVNQKDIDLLYQITQYIDSKNFPSHLSLFTFFMIQYSVLSTLAPQCQFNVVSDISRLVHLNSDMTRYFKLYLSSGFKTDQELTTFVVDNLIDFYSKNRYSLTNCESKLYFTKKLGKQGYSFSISNSLKDLFQGKKFPLQNVDITMDSDINLDGASDEQYVSMTLNFFSESSYDVSAPNGKGTLNLVTIMPSFNFIASQSSSVSSSIANICLDKSLKQYLSGIKVPIGVDYLNKAVSVNSSGATTLNNDGIVRLTSKQSTKRKVSSNQSGVKSSNKKMSQVKQPKQKKNNKKEKNKSNRKKTRTMICSCRFKKN